MSLREGCWYRHRRYGCLFRVCSIAGDHVYVDFIVYPEGTDSTGTLLFAPRTPAEPPVYAGYEFHLTGYAEADDDSHLLTNVALALAAGDDP